MTQPASAATVAPHTALARLGAVEDLEQMAVREHREALLKYALIVVASVPVLMVYPFVQRYFVKGVMIGALKG